MLHFLLNNKFGTKGKLLNYYLLYSYIYDESTHLNLIPFQVTY